MNNSSFKAGAGRMVLYAIGVISCIGFLSFFLVFSKDHPTKTRLKNLKNNIQPWMNQTKHQLRTSESSKISLSTTPVFQANDHGHTHYDESKQHRLDQYCSESMFPGVEGDKFIGSNNFELSKLVVTIRHGDRSGIHTMPGSIREKFDKAIQFHPLIDMEALYYSPSLKNFELEEIGKYRSGESIENALNPTHAFQQSDYNLTQGQLTSRGFMQHIQLGKLLNQAYKNYLHSNALTAKDLYIRSTNYVRTIRSISALLIGFFGGKLQDSKHKVPIKVFLDESDEIMHGVGLRSSSHSVNASNHQETEFSGQCKNAISYAKNERKVSLRKFHLIEKLAKVFDPQVSKMIATELVDSSMPSYCHSMPLPCSSNASEWIDAAKNSDVDFKPFHLRHQETLQTHSHRNRCLQNHHLQELMGEADYLYCQRFAGQFGGLNATKLAMFPFMTELLYHLQSNNSKISFFSGHDTVIAPVLAALGVYKNSLCIWPQYASRIVFEVWKKRETHSKSFLKHHDLLPRAKSFLQYIEKEFLVEVSHQELLSKNLLSSDTFVRVIFNGLDVTEKIPTCFQERIALSYEIVKGNINQLSEFETSYLQPVFPLCSMSAFSRQITELISPFPTFQEACSSN